MQHTDQEFLALMALGEAPSSAETQHVSACPQCAAELLAFRRAVGAARSATLADIPMTPPPGIWAGIAAELELSTPSGPEDSGDLDTPPTPRPHPDGGPGPGAAVSLEARSPSSSRSVDTAPAPPPGRSPRSARAKRSLRLSLALAACGALLGAAVGGGFAWWLADGDTPEVAGTSRQLEPLVPAALGTARLGDAAGQRKLDITVDGLPKTTGYFEVWLMDRDHKKLISMGVLGPDGHAVLPVPDNVDLDEYSVVDVSVQAYNGKPDHSGRSVVRGAYAAS